MDEEEAGGRGGLAVGTFPRPRGGRCPVLFPPPPVYTVRGGGVPPMGVCARCRGYRTPLGADMKRPFASPPSTPARQAPLGL